MLVLHRQRGVLYSSLSIFSCVPSGPFTLVSGRILSTALLLVLHTMEPLLLPLLLLVEPINAARVGAIACRAAALVDVLSETADRGITVVAAVLVLLLLVLKFLVHSSTQPASPVAW